MHHPHTIHLNYQSAKTGAYLCACFGCGAVFEYNGDTCNSSGCHETWKRKVAEYNGEQPSAGDIPMPPLDPPASEQKPSEAESNVIELPEGSKANLDLD